MKKLCVLLMSGLMLVTSVPMTGFAATSKTLVADATTVAEPTDTKNTTEPTDAALKSAILAVKDKITIPKEYSKFTYYYYASNSYREAYWRLNWSNPDTGANIAVSCDLDYNITYFNSYDYNDNSTGIAKYLKNELQKKAESFASKIAPQTEGHLKFVDSEYSNIYGGDYIYNYIRTENGVDFPDNNVAVYVSSFTGEVTSISINWIYNVKIPAADTKVTKDDATASLKKNMKMKLVYKSNNYVIYDKISGDPKTKAFLVYEPSEEYISVDAKTGKIYTTKIDWHNESDKNSSSKEASATADMASGSSKSKSSLSEDEIAKVEELKNLISKSEAIKLITSNTNLYKDKNMTQYSATLDQWYDETSDTKYIWNVNLSDPRKVTDKDSYRGYAYATVDAVTGKILSYNSSLKSNYNDEKQKWNSVSIKYDKSECKKVLEKFLKSEMNSRFSNTVLSTQINDYIAYYNKKEEPVYGGYLYQYNRVNDGIEFPDNNITGAVDGVTGKIYSLNTNWSTNITFESATGVISADEAMKYYLSKDGYGLKYEINQINKNTKDSDTYSVDYEIRLVYRPDIDPQYISPFTGSQLNRNGEVYKKTATYVYKDVANTEANRNILLLADMNIGFAGDNFLPNQNITLGEVKTLLTSVGYGYATIEGDDGALITREELAQLFITWMNLDKLAKLKIYNTGYTDSNAIDSKYIGAVALAKGLGIMDGDSGNFNPKKNVTRYDAVNYILNFIDAQRKSIY